MTEQVTDTPVVDSPAVDAPIVDTPVVDTPVVKPVAIEHTDFAIPENVELADGVIDSFKALAKEQGLNQEQAQKFMDLQTNQYTAAKESWAKTVTDWQESAKSDPEYGQANFEANSLLANQALDKFAPELKEFLAQSGLGNHPDMIRAFVRIGKSISNDAFVDGAKHSGADTTAAKRMYPNM
jgi:hypothetical protein